MNRARAIRTGKNFIYVVFYPSLPAPENLTVTHCFIYLFLNVLFGDVL